MTGVLGARKRPERRGASSVSSASTPGLSQQQHRGAVAALRMMPTARRMVQLFDRLAEQRRREPDDRLITALVQDAAETITGQRPVLSTTGGTSDARFMHKACPTCELGLLNETAHKVDEFAPLEDVRTLARIYTKVLADYFAAFS